MHRRELLRAAAAAAALSLLPGEAHAAWSRVANKSSQQPATSLTAAQRATLGALADAIIPRTDTPSATDVGVLAWIDVIIADYYTSDDRALLLTGLDAIDAMARQGAGQPFSALTGAPLVAIMTALDVPSDRTLPAVRGYQRAKGLVIHGYFTSERVQKDVLKNEIMPGRFVGDAPMPARSGAGRDE